MLTEVKEEEEKVMNRAHKISRINTSDSILLTNNKLILVHGTSKCHKILAAKALKQNKILKIKDEIAFYVEEQKSK